jgi:hypothetical protein
MWSVAMREDDAKKLWCPMVRCDAGSDDSGLNRTHIYGSTKASSGEPWSRCITSQCMMWRGRLRCDTHAVTGEQDTYEDGYCGIAGKP